MGNLDSSSLAKKTFQYTDYQLNERCDRIVEKITELGTS